LQTDSGRSGGLRARTARYRHGVRRARPLVAPGAQHFLQSSSATGTGLARAWRRQTPQPDVHFHPEVWTALERIDALIKEGQTFRLDTFAHGFGLTSRKFSHLFQTTTGLLPTEYFGRRRTQHAAHLLLESDLNIGEIAARLGFCDAGHLSRSFLQNEGVSPRVYRNLYRVGQER
ncbi:MAG: AraC family transcriptional regulator, partial [Proteobacteria bacterium]